MNAQLDSLSRAYKQVQNITSNGGASTCIGDGYDSDAPEVRCCVKILSRSTNIVSDYLCCQLSDEYLNNRGAKISWC